MSQKFWNNTSFVEVLTAPGTRPKQRLALFQTASSEQLKLILELIGNTLGGVLLFSQTAYAKLRPKRNLYKKLWDGATALAEKRRDLLKHIRSVSILLRAIHSDIVYIVNGGGGEESVPGPRTRDDTEKKRGKKPKKKQSESFGPPRVPRESVEDSSDEGSRRAEEEGEGEEEDD